MFNWILRFLQLACSQNYISQKHICLFCFRAFLFFFRVDNNKSVSLSPSYLTDLTKTYTFSLSCCHYPPFLSGFGDFVLKLKRDANTWILFNLNVVIMMYPPTSSKFDSIPLKLLRKISITFLFLFCVRHVLTVFFSLCLFQVNNEL